MDEKELIELVRRGDQRAFRELYDSNVDRIYRLTFRMAGRDDLARDFTQETFVRAYQKIGQFRGEAAFSTWLHSVAVSVTLNGLRKVDRHRKRETDLGDAAHLGAPDTTPDHDLKERLHAAIDGLPEIYRTVFLMHDVEGFSHDEIGRTLGVAQGTSKARLSRARGKLRKSLGDFAEEFV